MMGKKSTEIATQEERQPLGAGSTNCSHNLQQGRERRRHAHLISYLNAALGVSSGVLGVTIREFLGQVQPINTLIRGIRLGDQDLYFGYFGFKLVDFHSIHSRISFPFSLSLCFIFCSCLDFVSLFICLILFGLNAQFLVVNPCLIILLDQSSFILSSPYFLFI